jgi:hypothetical protein
MLVVDSQNNGKIGALDGPAPSFQFLNKIVFHAVSLGARLFAEPMQNS